MWIHIAHLMLIVQLCVESAVSGDLESFLDEVETDLDKLKDTALQFYEQRCGIDCTPAFDSNSYGCSTDIISNNGSLCSTVYGSAFYTSEPGCMSCSNRTVNQYFSTVQTPSSGSTCTDSLNSDICWTKEMEDSFRSESIEGMRWRLIATANGFIRIHPGIPQEDCYSYDPRLRSWYVAASSGPKDVVILVDSSSSMDFVPKDSKTGQSRMDLAKQAVNHVLGTLTFADYVAVIHFSTEANEVPVNSVYTLIQATRDNIQALTSEVNKIEPDGHTNFEQAFRLAFDMFDRSAAVDRTSGCNKAILFLTDGSPTRGEEDPRKLSKIVESLNTGPNGTQIASIFSYSIGEVSQDETRKDILQQITCTNNGLMAEVETDDGTVSLQDQLSQYHGYYSTLHTGPSYATWTEPYFDSFGADQVITAAKAIYDNSSAFVGVVAMDISYDYINKLEDNYDKLLAVLHQRQKFCSQVRVDKDCDLEVLRQKMYTKEGISYAINPDKVCNKSSMCVLPSNQVCPDAPFKYDQCQQHKTASQNYKEESCCGDFESCSSAFSLNFLPATSFTNIKLCIPVVGLIYYCMSLLSR